MEQPVKQPRHGLLQTQASSTETPADESKYVMGTALANGTTANIAQGLAKSIVEAGIDRKAATFLHVA